MGTLSISKLAPAVFISVILILSLPVSAFAIVYDPAIEIANPTPVAADNFGFSVSIDGNNVLVGAISDDTGATNAGAAYLYEEFG